MKEWILPVIVFGFILVVTGFYCKKISLECDPIDKVENALSGLKPLVSHSGCRVVSCQPYKITNEILFWVKYALAPAYVSSNKLVSDSVLYIYPVASADSINSIVLNNRKTIWKNNDGQYEYIFTTIKKK